MSHGFSGGKQAIKLPSVRNRGQVVVYSGQQRIRNFHLKDDNGKLWVEVIIVNFFGCCSDRRCFYSNRGTQRQFSENICLEDDLRSRIFGTFVVKFLACLPLLGLSNIYKMA